MKKIYYVLMSAFFVFSLGACSGSNGKTNQSEQKSEANKDEKFTIKPASTSISGAFEGCFEIVDKEYPINILKTRNEKVAVEFGRTDKETPIDLSLPRDYRIGFDNNSFLYGDKLVTYVNFKIEILNAEGEVISSADASDYEKITELMLLQPGNNMSFYFSVNITEEAKSFRIISYCGNDPEEIASKSESNDGEDNYNGSESETLSVSSSSSDWDKVLNEFEDYVDSYMSLMKKATAGDINAMSEYTTMMEKAQSLSEKLDGAQDQMTASQISRYMKILNKMTSGAL